ncbi:MAG: type 4a pilus biogenesis protein PilO [Vicinamibacterales bacterium]
MRALFGTGGSVPLSRVAAEHRRWLWPLGLLLAVNLALLGLVVLPLTRAVAASEQRAAAAEAALVRAADDFRDAEATRDSKAQATTDLERFYEDVLPTDVASARRITHLRLQQLARQHGVDYQRMGATPEAVRDSSLSRLRVSMVLTGDYDDIRAFIYDLETAPEFVVIDNMMLAEGQDAQAPLSLTLELSTYYRTAANGG